MDQKKLAIVVSHPIQHFCPQYASWTQISGLDIKVIFASKHGLDSYYDPSFGKVIQWENLKLNFNYEFLPGAQKRGVGVGIDSPDLINSLSAYNPDIVLLYGYIQPLQRKAMAWAKRLNKSLFMIGDSEARRMRPLHRRIVKKIFLPRIFKNVDYFLTVGDANELYYRMYGVSDEKLIRASFPIDKELFDRALLKREFVRIKVRQKLNIPLTNIVILMVGKLVSFKRQKDLVDTLNILQEDGFINLTILLAGSGPEESGLKAVAAKYGLKDIVFAGFVPPEELISYYLASDIYVHCSEVDAHSLAISEAIYSGLPVLVSHRCGSYGPSDDVRHGLNGFVYKCGDTKSLVALVKKVVLNNELYGRMSHESRKIAIDNQRLAHGRAIIQAIDALHGRN